MRIVSGSVDRTVRVWDAKIDPGATQSKEKGARAKDTPLNLLIPGFKKCSLTREGWVKSSGKLLFWIPPDNRHRLVNPRLLLTIPPESRSRLTEFDFTNFHCGRSWTECAKDLSGTQFYLLAEPLWCSAVSRSTVCRIPVAHSWWSREMNSLAMRLKVLIYKIGYVNTLACLCRTKSRSGPTEYCGFRLFDHDSIKARRLPVRPSLVDTKDDAIRIIRRVDSTGARRGKPAEETNNESKAEGGEEAKEEEEPEEPVDPADEIREECSETPECKGAKKHFEHCQEKVQSGQGFKHEDCVEEMCTSAVSSRWISHFTDISTLFSVSVTRISSPHDALRKRAFIPTRFGVYAHEITRNALHQSFSPS
ncbi:hypothetical protein PIIN_08610 [Serendipita indica DSM 11827]|uniref:Ubiquinol-cytochrome C reductase hinge domain-containing protein n=1 Tax=Serendipita indica (strain DSM 11827) TaxID=1109443 RepID=G4TTL6_SERID|nr:hypothetical protein PIIN_08610 [Serendipita indica DSM 11827]